jgi:uncharacterized membrane protein (UPF0127 family)
VGKLDGVPLFPVVECAERLPDRMRGLLGRDGLPEGHALWIRSCGSIHTVGMRFALDLVFLDRRNRVVRVRRNVPPWRFAMGGRGACSVLEVRAGWLPDVARGAQMTLTVGDQAPIVS